MKKICVSVLCFLMVLALVGCGGNDASSAGSNEPSDETSQEDNNAEPSLDLTGSWIQAEGDDPILLTLRDDGSAYYYATVSNAADYTCPYSVEGSKLTIDMYNIDGSGVTTMVYDVKSDSEAGSKAQITLTLNSEASADPELLYGMEKLMEGTYTSLSFNDQQLKDISAALNVPDDLAVEITQSEPEYWSAAGKWLINVEIYADGNYVAGAMTDCLTLEPARNIMAYSS